MIGGTAGEAKGGVPSVESSRKRVVLRRKMPVELS
jgi:hypothetical protein